LWIKANSTFNLSAIDVTLQKDAIEHDNIVYLRICSLGGWGCNSGVALDSTHEALGSTPSTAKKNFKKCILGIWQTTTLRIMKRIRSLMKPGMVWGIH
jgi:hypothetical protein